MLNSDLLKHRLSQYGVAWLLSFVVTLLACLAVPALSHMRLVEVIDMVLPAMFLILGLLLIAGVVLALLSRARGTIKLLILLAALILALPLLWAPVLASVLAAYVMHVSIEYSQAYASFRIGVAQLLYPITTFAFGGAAESVWKLFQALSTIVGFLVGLHQLWNLMQSLTSGPRQQDDGGALSLD